MSTLGAGLRIPEYDMQIEAVSVASIKAGVGLKAFEPGSLDVCLPGDESKRLGFNVLGPLTHGAPGDRVPVLGIILIPLYPDLPAHVRMLPDPLGLILAPVCRTAIYLHESSGGCAPLSNLALSRPL